MTANPEKRFPTGRIVRFALALTYCCVVGALAAVLLMEGPSTKPLPRMTRALALEKQEATASLSLQGQALHKNVRILHAARVIDDRARLWEVLPGTSVQAVAVADQVALAACFINRLVSIDLSIPGQPDLLGSLELPSYIKKVVTVGQMALVSMAAGDGLALVDLSNPAEMELVALYPNEGSIADLVVSGGYAYYADLHQGLGRINLTAEKKVLEVVDPLRKPWRVATSGRRLIAASLSGELSLYELSREGQLEKAGTLMIPGERTGHLRGIALTPESLAVATADGTVRLFPLTSWPWLEQNASVSLPGTPYQMLYAPDRAELLISLVSGGVAMVDVKDSSQPFVSGHMMMPATIVSMVVQDDTVYTARQLGDKGLLAFDLARMAQSSIQPATYMDRNSYTLLAWNGQLFGYRRDQSLVALADRGDTGRAVTGPVLIVGENEGARVFTMADNGVVDSAGPLPVTGDVLDAIPLEGYHVLLYRDGLRILSGPQRDEPTVVGALNLSGRPVHLRHFKDHSLLVTTKDEGLKILDVSDWSRPSLLAIVTPPTHLLSTSIPQDVLVNGSIAYVSQGPGGLYVVDLARPDAPQLLQVIDTPGAAGKMVLHDNLLLIADGDEGIYMLDVSAPGHALPIGSLPTPLRAREIATTPDGVVISNYPSGTLLLPLPVRLNDHRIVSESEVKVEAPSGTVSGYAYLYDERTRSRVLIEAGVDE